MVFHTIKKIILFLPVLGILACSNNNAGENEDTTLKNDSTHRQILSFTTTDGYVKTDNVDLYYQIIGEGEPIVILHAGPGLWSNYLIPYLKPLAERYQLIFLDQRGNGNSSFPKDSSFSFNDYVADIEIVLNELNVEKPIILGHSFGGLLATMYASEHPEKIKKLLLVTPAPATSFYFEKTFNNRERNRSEQDTKQLIKLMSDKRFSQGDTTIFKKALVLAEKVNVFDTTKAAEIFNHLKITPQRAKNLLVIESIVEKNFWNLDFSQQLNKINTPTLIIHGSKDNIPVESDQVYLDNMKNAKLVMIKNSKHYPFAEQPTDFKQQVELFLENY